MGWVNKSLIKRSRSRDQDGRYAHIRSKTLKKKIIFFGTKRQMTLKVGMQLWVLKFYQVCSSDDLGMTLNYFTARTTLVPYPFVLEKGKTIYVFSRNYCSLT